MTLLTITDLIALAKPTIKTITAEQAYTLMNKTDGVMIDVREPAEFTQHPIAGSINIPRGVLEIKIVSLCQSADQPMFLHCASGNRAMLAAEQLQRLGYNNVYAITCNVEQVFACQKLQ